MSNDFPEQIGAYVPERLIGRGGMAAVYLARGPDGEAVALKWVEQVHTANLRRFEREIDALERSSHPGVVGHRAHGVHAGRPYLVMDWVDGLDLRLYAPKLHQRPPAERYARCRTIGQALCEALEHLHGNGLVHRDVKPSNVLIASDARVVLTDLGVVKDLDQETVITRTGLLVGTLSFASPEQVAGGEIDPRTDLFGLGATLYFLLTLRRPFEGLDREGGERAPPPGRFDPGIPPDLEAVVLRLMADSPEDRYPNAAEAGRALSAGRATGIPIAGRQEALALVADALQAAQEGEALVIRPLGPRGIGRGWLADMVRMAARRRGLAVFEVRDPEHADEVVARLRGADRMVVVSPLALNLPEGVRCVDVPLYPLGVADVRRTVVAAAPLTRRPAQMAERLHRLSGGLPALLVPLIDGHCAGQALILPEDVPIPTVVEDFLSGLELDDVEVLGVLALASHPVDAGLVERAAQVPAAEALARLAEGGIVRRFEDRWALSAGLFRRPVLLRLPDPEGLAARVRAAEGNTASLARATRVGGIVEGARLSLMAGELAAALSLARRAVALSQGVGDRASEAGAGRQLGEILLVLGATREARRVLSDSTALARAADLVGERRRCHVRRAQVSLDEAPGDRTAAAAAVDRLLDMGEGKAGPSFTEALRQATWARAAAVIGDQRNLERAIRAVREGGVALEQVEQLELGLELARACAAAGAGPGVDEALAALDGARGRFPVLDWQADCLRASILRQPRPEAGEMSRGLSPRQIEQLAARRDFSRV